MNTKKTLKWVLVALLMSAMTFELLPGSVKYFAKDLATAPETAVYNFFTVEAESIAASCLPLAGIVTFAVLALALVAVCFRKAGLYKTVSWCCLAAAALAAIPYVVASEDVFLQPNVVVILLLTGCWLLAMSLSKNSGQAQAEKIRGRRL